MKARAAAWILASLAAGTSVAQEAPVPSPPRAQGGLAWLLSGDLDLLGRMTVDLPVSVPGPLEPFGAVDAATTISRSASGFTFLVRDLVYALEAGARVRRTAGPVPRFFVGQRGRERADAAGRGWIRELGGGAESPGWGNGAPPSGIVWSAAAGAIVGRRDTPGDAFARGGARFTRPAGRISWGVDLFVDALLSSGALHADLEAGPRLDFPWATGRRASLYLRWLRSRHPLGLGVDAAAAGFEVASAAPAARPRPTAPDIRGTVAFGAGDGFAAGRFEMLASSPPFGACVHAVLDVDANVRSAPDVNELFYLYDAGVQAPWRGAVIGGGFYHRSNHVLDADNPSVTSINVLEAGIETRSWNRAPDLDGTGRWRWLDARLRAGWLIDSAFGHESRVHGRGGVRAWIPTGTDAVPFASVEGEAGDVSRVAAAAGVLFRNGVDARVEYARDDQLYSRQQGAWFVGASVRY